MKVLGAFFLWQELSATAIETFVRSERPLFLPRLAAPILYRDTLFGPQLCGYDIYQRTGLQPRFIVVA